MGMGAQMDYSDLETCEQHNTFYNYKFVDMRAKHHKTYN
jgi:hypothetical protein